MPATASAGSSTHTVGLLGQAENTLVLLTTNEDLARLHPAVIRPGRCLASIEIPRFPKFDVDQWLTRRGATVGPSVAGATLAELYEPDGAAPGRHRP